MFKKFIFILCFILQAYLPEFCFGYDLTAIQNLVSTREIKTISMDFKEAQLADVLKIFSKLSGLNFIASSDISDKEINLYLDKVPIEEALERILSANSLTYELKQDSNIFIVKKLTKPDLDLMSRIYPLRFASVSSAKLNSMLSSGSSSESSGEGGASGGASGGSAAGGGAAAGGSTGIIDAVKSVLSKDGSVIEDSRTNSIIITDIPTQFPNIEQVLAKIDVRIPQILIEVEMLDISKNTADLLGAKWGETLGDFTGTEKITMFPFNPNNGFQTDDKVIPEGAEDGATTLYRGGSLSFNNFKVSLQFLKTQTDTKSLARPHILTLNNETAEIKIETNEAIQIDSTTDEETNETTTTVVRESTGVSLRVTPQANLLTNEITLAVEPSVKEAKPSSLVSPVAQIKDPEERTSKSLLRVKNGDTIVIGGLLRSDVTDTRTGIPGISKIPLVGAAFRHKDKSEQQRELIIFITPHILDEDVDSSQTTSAVSILDREQSLNNN